MVLLSQSVVVLFATFLCCELLKLPWQYLFKNDENQWWPDKKLHHTSSQHVLKTPFCHFMGISGLLYIYDSFHHILVQNKNKSNILTANYGLGARGHQEQSRRGADRQRESESTLLRAKLNQQWIALNGLRHGRACTLGSQESRALWEWSFLPNLCSAARALSFCKHILGCYRAALFQAAAPFKSNTRKWGNLICAMTLSMPISS